MRVTSLALLLPSIAGIAMAAPMSDSNKDVGMELSKQWDGMCLDFAKTLGPKVQIVESYFHQTFSLRVVDDGKKDYACRLRDNDFKLDVNATDVAYLKWLQARITLNDGNGGNDGMQKM